MNWANGDAFEGTSVFGHTVRTDTARRVGGDESGPKPTELLLFGIASCTGVDVVRIMRKARQPLDSLKITVKAEQNEDYPKPFHTVRIHFVAKGKGISEKRLKKAIELSGEKYCVVSQTVARPASVSTSFEIVES